MSWLPSSSVISLYEQITKTKKYSTYISTFCTADIDIKSNQLFLSVIAKKPSSVWEFVCVCFGKTYLHTYKNVAFNSTHYTSTYHQHIVNMSAKPAKLWELRVFLKCSVSSVGPIIRICTSIVVNVSLDSNTILVYLTRITNANLSDMQC